MYHLKYCSVLKGKREQGNGEWIMEKEKWGQPGRSAGKGNCSQDDHMKEEYNFN